MFTQVKPLFFLIAITSAAYRDPCEGDTLEYICGTDGRTYKNLCYAELVGVSQAYPGKCVNCENCTGIQQLVCGNDGKTYTNSCWADCNGAIVVNSGPCQTQCNCPSNID